jgi:hypothetical protein
MIDLARGPGPPFAVIQFEEYSDVLIAGFDIRSHSGRERTCEGVEGV